MVTDVPKYRVCPFTAPLAFGVFGCLFVAFRVDAPPVSVVTAGHREPVGGLWDISPGDVQLAFESVRSRCTTITKSAAAVIPVVPETLVNVVGGFSFAGVVNDQERRTLRRLLKFHQCRYRW